MDDVLVGSLMSSPVRTVTADASLRAAARTMTDRDISSVVVVDDANRPVGILTATDCVRALAEDVDATDASVSTYGSGDPVTTTVNESVSVAAETMLEHNVHHLPVVDDTEGTIGMITTTDFAAYLSESRAPRPPRSTD